MVRGLAIVMIVIWHGALDMRLLAPLPGALAGLMQLLGEIRLPAFFLCSGLVTGRMLGLGPRAFFTRRLATPLWLILIWTGINLAFELLVHPLSLRRDTALTVAPHQLFWVPYGNLWFLYAVVAVAALAWAIRRWPVLAQMLLVVALMLGLRGLNLPALPETLAWLLGRLWLQALPYFMIGIWAAPWLLAFWRADAGLRWRAGLSVLAGLAAAVLWRLNLPGGGLSGGAGLSAGIGPALGLVMTAGFISGLAWIAAAPRWARPRRALVWLGQHSVQIYVAHQLFIALAMLALQPWLAARPSPAPALGAGLWLIVAAFAVAGPLALARLAGALGAGWLYAPPARLRAGAAPGASPDLRPKEPSAP